LLSTDENGNDEDVIRLVPKLLLVASVAFLSGCYNVAEIAEELQFAHQKPNEADLIGKWVPTAQTLKDMRTNGGYAISTHELVLNSDKNFSMKNMPDWWATAWGESKRGFGSASGKWALLSKATYSHDWGVDLVVGTAEIGFVPVRNQSPPYLLHVGIGDPDNGHFMLFERLKLGFARNAYRKLARDL